MKVIETFDNGKTICILSKEELNKVGDEERSQEIIKDKNEHIIKLTKENQELKRKIVDLEAKLDLVKESFNRYFKKSNQFDQLYAEASTLREDLHNLKDKYMQKCVKYNDKEKQIKALLQDKNAVINLTKSLLYDIWLCESFQLPYLLQQFISDVENLNLGNNDSNTHTYLKLKKERDDYARENQYLDNENYELIKRINKIEYVLDYVYNEMRQRMVDREKIIYAIENYYKEQKQ